MWIQDKYININKYKRDGVLSYLTLPKSTKVREELYKLNIKSKSLDFVKGKDVYIISDEIGISENVSFSYFFVNDFLCIKLIKGNLYVKDENNKVFSINNKNKIVEYTSDIKYIEWKTKSEFEDFSNFFTKNKYNLISEIDKRSYVNNLLFIVETEYKYNVNKLFNFKLKEIKESIGGSFEFVVKEKVEEKPSTYNILLNEDKYLYEEEKKKESKKFSLYPDEDEDIDEYDEISSNLHEIDLFKEYSSIDDSL